MTAGKNKLSQQKKKKINGGSADGLGRALMKSRFHGAGKKPILNPDGSIRHTTEMDDTSIRYNMKSVTEESDLDAFLNTAALAGTDFVAERQNITVISMADTKSGPSVNPFLLSAEKERETLALHDHWKMALKIPRRPHWDETTTPEQLNYMERESFLDWRRSLAMLEEQEGLLMTPYERNIEVWKQLWRVIERSSLLVQIVDARNPLLFRCVDMENYVNEVDSKKKNLLLVNKADMLTLKQRKEWAAYFKEQNIAFTFFSAAMARESLENEDKDSTVVQDTMSDTTEANDGTQILNAYQLIELLNRECPVSGDSSNKMIGFVGYPNVGKSSTLNALVGAKKVAVGSTPGKTKHFQTIHLSDNMILCDCPGLVFPSFATTKADMVCNGVLPIDQLREYLGPVGIICRRVPKRVLEKLYGIKIRTINEQGQLEDRSPHASEFLKSYAVARGYTRSSQGNPDEARAARYILKDYVNGKILFVHAPPHLDPIEFNQEIYDSVVSIAQTMNKLQLNGKEETGKTSVVPVKEILSQISESIVDENGEVIELSQEEITAALSEFRQEIEQQNEQVEDTSSKSILVSSGATRAQWYTAHDLKPASTGASKAVMNGLPPKKSHKKGRKNVKTRTHWTAQE